ncbi:MAG TPA: NAD(P)-dependent oxidoreductase [Burkholderiales bacterium]|nr:NAD(P)-dependent oxidoreductase [Burkholderiales bacterium]
MKVGLAGIGRMGAAIATRLMACGHEITVWNRTPGKIAPLVAAGAKVATTPAALAREAEVVITILTDAAAIEAVYYASDGLVAGIVSNPLVLEMSTVRPQAKQKLGAVLAAKRAVLVDCPVGGSTDAALGGKLLGFAGGEAADFQRARPVLEQLCRRVEHVGPVGAGARMKLAINLPLLVYWQALGEALALCRPLGLDPQRVMDIFADTAGGPNLLKARGSKIAAALAERETGPVTFDVDSIRKDLRTMIEEARALGANLPLAERALECFDQAARAGLGACDGVALPARWAKRADG